MHEPGSCIGGASNAFIAALVANSPALEQLDISFQPHSAAADTLNDTGVVTACEGLRRLKRLALRGCTSLTNRVLYSVGANLRDLQQFTLATFSEVFSRHGVEFICNHCSALAVLELDSGLRGLVSNMRLDSCHGQRLHLQFLLPATGQVHSAYTVEPGANLPHIR